MNRPIRLIRFFAFSLICAYIQAQSIINEFESQLPPEKKWNLVWNDKFEGNVLDTMRHCKIGHFIFCFLPF